jgi:hypothetical protein
MHLRQQSRSIRCPPVLPHWELVVKIGPRAEPSLSTPVARAEAARSEYRVMVKRILNKYGHPTDLQEAVKTVLAQAQLLCRDWVDMATPQAASLRRPSQSGNIVLCVGGSTGAPAKLNFDVGDSSDLIQIVTGQLTANPGGGVITITPLGGFGPGVFDLLEFPAGQGTGLKSLSLANTEIAGYSASLRTTSNAEQLVVVPEPTFLAAVFGIGVGYMSQRRRHRLV